MSFGPNRTVEVWQKQEDPGCLKNTPLCPAESEQLTIAFELQTAIFILF